MGTTRTMFVFAFPTLAEALEAELHHPSLLNLQRAKHKDLAAEEVDLLLLPGSCGELTFSLIKRRGEGPSAQCKYCVFSSLVRQSSLVLYRRVVGQT